MERINTFAMNTTVRSVLSSVTGIAAYGFVIHSAVSTGFESYNTVLGIAGLVIWSLVQMLALDFAASPVRGPGRAGARRVPAGVDRERAPAMIEFPRPIVTRRAA
jgi:hypothetical protein